MARARQLFLDTLKLDPENVTAHYNLGLIYRELGDEENALLHRQLHARYKPDDNARDLAASAHRRRNPAANHAADAVVVYDLHRAAAYGYGNTTDTGANAADER